MANTRTKPFSLPEAMQGYLIEHNSAPSEHHRALIDHAETMAEGGMRLSTEAGTFLTILTHAIRPSFVVEVGTFIGYSSLCIAGALVDDARMLCCDVSEQWTDVARDAWQNAGVDGRIQLVIAPASETLAALPSDPPVDLAFIDADKSSYVDYYEELVPRLSPRGVIAVDNTMWAGRVLDTADTSEDTVAIRAFNDHVANDPRTTNVTVPIGDGITLISATAGVQ